MPIYRGDGGSGDATTDAYASQIALYAKEAEEQADIATNKANDAEAARVATQALYDDFDKRYLGPKDTEPTVDNKGDPLETGALFFNTTDDAMYMYNGAVWLLLTGAGGAGGGGAVESVNGQTGVVTITAADIGALETETDPTVPQYVKDITEAQITAWDSGVQLDDLSVTVNPEGVANLQYNSTNGVFTYTPPDLSSYVTSSDVSGYGFITADSSDTLTNKSGNISQWTNDSGYITGNETITLTGAITGSGTTSIATTLSTIDGGSY